MMKRCILVSLFLSCILVGFYCVSKETLLNSPDPDLRRKGISKLAARGKVKYIAHFIEMLQHDPDYLVRAQAAQALGDLKATSALPALVKALEDPSQWVRLDTALALGKLGDRNATAPLVQVLTYDRFSGVRRAAARALAMLKDPEAIPGLISRLEDIDEGVAEISYQALCEITRQKLAKELNVWQEWYEKSRAPK